MSKDARCDEDEGGGRNECVVEQSVEFEAKRETKSKLKGLEGGKTRTSMVASEKAWIERRKRGCEITQLLSGKLTGLGLLVRTIGCPVRPSKYVLQTLCIAA